MNTGRTVRDARYHLIRRAAGFDQLFDLALDPREERDLMLEDSLDDGAADARDRLSAALDALPPLPEPETE